MTEHTGFAPSPIPAEPSPESVRLAKRLSGGRKLQARIRPHGVSLRLLRLATALAGRAWWSPKGSRAARFGGVRGRQVSTSDTTHGILLWLHGGGFVSGTPRMDQWLAARYAAAARLPAFVPRYRLAPEHPFPAAADDVLAAYRGLLDEGFTAKDIRVAGVSSGGALAAGLLGDLGHAAVATDPRADRRPRVRHRRRGAARVADARGRRPLRGAAVARPGPRLPGVPGPRGPGRLRLRGAVPRRAGVNRAGVNRGHFFGQVASIWLSAVRSAGSAVSR
jgi:acetyl esterase/lipase